MSAKTYAIKCTHCAAPLDLLGGGRVASITCKYCHSQLDLTNHYNILATFNNVPRPQSPFEIGMKGRIKGVEWTIIGWVRYKTAAFPSETWDEFFLYSPTHGYAWLIQDNKNISFSKRVRNFDVFAWKTKPSKTIFYNKGHYIQQESAYDIYVNYVEGSLSSIVKFGDTITCRDYYGVNRKTITIELQQNEIEIYLVEKLNPTSVYNTFNIPKEKQTIKQNLMDKLNQDTQEEPIEDFEAPQKHSRSILMGFLMICLLLASLAIASKFFSTPVYETDFNVNIEQNITIDSSGFLTSIYFLATGNGLSSNLQIWLYKEGKKIFYIDSDKVYFNKQDLGESWRYGSNAIVYLKLDEGTYKLIAKKTNPNINIHLRIQQNVIRLTYILPLLIILILLLLISYSHVIRSKIGLIILIIVAVIIGYNLFGFIALFGLGYFYFFIYGSYDDYHKTHRYDDDWDDDYDDDWDD